MNAGSGVCRDRLSIPNSQEPIPQELRCFWELGVGAWGVHAFFSIPLQIFLEELVLTAFAGGAPRRLGLPQLDAADLS